MTRRFALSTALLGMLLAPLLLGGVVRTRAQDDGPVEQPAVLPCPRVDVEPNTRAVAGFLSCVQCHDKGLTDQPIRLPGGRTARYGKDTWVLYKEYSVWIDNDRHQQAFAVLRNERSQKMGEILNLPFVTEADGTKVYQTHRDKRCLACHTGFPIDRLTLDESHPGLVAADALEIEEVIGGVTCEGCHGPSGGGAAGVEGWFEPHKLTPNLTEQGKTAWRHLSPDVKAEVYGYVDVRSPVARTRMCLSCHLGDASEGRVVTHEMYAAGHPVLPGFEMESFVRQLPEHWMPFPQKDAEVREEFLANTRDPLYKDGYAVANLHQTKSMLVAAVVSVAESLRLNGELATDHVAVPVEKGMWPELSQFDCFACHHELEDGGWRFERQPVLSRPGRPTLREWPGALLEVAERIAKSKNRGANLAIDKLEAPLAEVAALVGQYPYGGNPATFAARSCAASVAADELALLLEATTFAHDEAGTVLATIADVARRPDVLWDYDSARQLAWAFETVLVETEAQANRDPALPPLPNAAALREKIVSLTVARGEPAVRLLTLDLRLARERQLDIGGEGFRIQEIDNEERLAPIREYDPLEFRAVFDAIAPQLPAPVAP